MKIRLVDGDRVPMFPLPDYKSLCCHNFIDPFERSRINEEINKFLRLIEIKQLLISIRLVIMLNRVRAILSSRHDRGKHSPLLKISLH